MGCRSGHGTGVIGRLGSLWKRAMTGRPPIWKREDLHREILRAKLEILCKMRSLAAASC